MGLSSAEGPICIAVESKQTKENTGVLHSVQDDDIKIQDDGLKM